MHCIVRKIIHLSTAVVNKYIHIFVILCLKFRNNSPFKQKKTAGAVFFVAIELISRVL